MSPETKKFLNKYWMAIIIATIPIIVFGYVSFSGIYQTIYEDDHPSITDEDWLKDNYGGTEHYP